MNRLSIIPMLAMSACGGAQIEGAPKAGDVIDVPGFQWRVVDQRTMDKAYSDAGIDAKGGILHGFAGRTMDGRAVIYTLPPKHVNDDVTMTLGHEVLHIPLGAYHPE